MSSVLFRSSLVRRCLRAQTFQAIKTLAVVSRYPSCAATFTRSQIFPPAQSVRCLSTTTGDCPGCGAPFQPNDPSQPGYLSPRKKSVETKKKKQQNKSLSDEEYQNMLATLDPETLALLGDSVPVKTESRAKRTVCERCHELHHHHQSTTESTPEFLRSSQQYGSLAFLKTKRDPLVVAVCDVTDLPGSLADLPQLLSQNPGTRVHLAVNKFDLLPASSRRHEQRIRDWIVQHVKGLGLPTSQLASVTLISAKKGWGVNGLMHRLDDDRRPTDDIYLVGCTNVGKSALVNRFMSQIRGALDHEGRRLKKELKDKYMITSSAIPGTTMGTIKIPLHVLGMSDRQEKEQSRFMVRERYLIDTPGVVNDNQLIHQMSFQDQKTVVNQTELNPVTFKLEPGKSLLLKPLVRMDLLESSDPVLFTLFSPLVPHITRTEKLPPAYALEYKTHGRPVKDTRILRSDDLAPIEEIVRVSNHASHAAVDLSFAGVGWVSLTGLFRNAKIRVWIPKGLDSSKAFGLRDPPLLPFEFRGSIRKFYGSGERTNK